MNIFVLLYLVAYFNIPEVEATARSVRRANKQKAIARKRRVGRSAIGAKLWFDEPEITYAHTWMPRPEFDGLYVDSPNLSPSKVYDKPQQNRWDTFEWKQRAFIYNGRVHVGDHHRKGKRPYRGERTDKERADQLWVEYLEYGE